MWSSFLNEILITLFYIELFFFCLSTAAKSPFTHIQHSSCWNCCHAHNNQIKQPLEICNKMQALGTVILSYRKARICGSLVKIKARNATPAPSTTAIPKSIPQTLHFVLESIIMRYVLLEFDSCSVTQRCVSFVKRIGNIS